MHKPNQNCGAPLCCADILVVVSHIPKNRLSNPIFFDQNRHQFWCPPHIFEDHSRFRELGPGKINPGNRNQSIFGPPKKKYVKTCVPCRSFLTGGNVVTSSVPCNSKMWILRISELRWRCKISESCVQFLRVDSRSPCSLVDTYRRDAVRSCLANMDLSNWAPETAWQLP